MSAGRTLPIFGAMPVRWTISHEQRLVIAKTQGVVTLKDVEAYLDALVVSDAMPYAKLFDASDIDPQGSDDDVMALGACMRAYVATLPGGPLALAAAPRPVNVFQTVDEARDWLDAQPR